MSNINQQLAQAPPPAAPPPQQVGSQPVMVASAQQQQHPAASTGSGQKRPYADMTAADAVAVAVAGTVPSSISPSAGITTDQNGNAQNFVRKAVGKDGEPLSEKKLRRLEKNRLSARECRRRKREATENMERQINLLEGENLRLRLQLQVGDEAQESMQQEQHKLTEGLDGLLKSGGSESEIYAKIEEYKEKFADYGRDRRSAIEFHLRNVERLLMPTQTTSVVLATLQGGSAATAGSGATASSSETLQEAGNEPVIDADSANVAVPSSSAPPKDTKALFQHLVNILQVTPEQASSLKDSRFVAQEMDEILKETLSVLTELRGRLTQCGEDLETEFNNVRAILTPSQSAKFLVWVAQNKACMHMLNELWSKVYPPADKDGDANNSDDAGGGEISP